MNQRKLQAVINRLKDNIKNIKCSIPRITKENAQVDVRLTYKTGLDKYYGLVDLAEESGLFKKVSTRYELPDGNKQYAKTINNEPGKYFTKEVLEKIDEYTKRKFTYGTED